MNLTDEEKKLFGLNNDLNELPSHYIERGILESYDENNKTVQITFGYIKRLLLEVAEKRELDISSDIAFDTDELLKSIVDVPDKLTDFDPLFFKSFDELNNYVQSKICMMDSTEMQGFLRCFNGSNGIGGLYYSFHNFIGQYINKLLDNIDKLYHELLYCEDPTGSLDDDWFEENEEPEEKSEMAEIKELSDEERDEFLELIDLEYYDWEFAEGSSQYEKDKEKLTNQELSSCIKFLNSYPLLIKYKKNGLKIVNELFNLVQKTKLNEFYSNKEFYEDFKKIFAHDLKKHVFHFHGTQSLKSADTIIREGLGMMKEDLSTTTYPELSMDEVMLYSRGFGGEIGRDAIVIIDQPIQEGGKQKRIVEPLPKGKKIHFTPSGLQGLTGKPNYIVNPQYIVGYVDKKNKKIVYNDKYYDYDRFGLNSDGKRPQNVTFSNERIAEGIARFNPNELVEQVKQLED